MRVDDKELEALARSAFEINLDLYHEANPVSQQHEALARELALGVDVWESQSPAMREHWRRFVRRLVGEMKETP